MNDSIPLPSQNESVETLKQTRSGTVSALLYERGLWLITDDADGKTYPFHCTACVHSVEWYEALFYRARVKFEIAQDKSAPYGSDGKKHPYDAGEEFKSPPGEILSGFKAVNVESIEDPSSESDWCVIQVGNAVDEILVGIV